MRSQTCNASVSSMKDLIMWLLLRTYSLDFHYLALFDIMELGKFQTIEIIYFIV